MSALQAVSVVAFVTITFWLLQFVSLRSRPEPWCVNGRRHELIEITVFCRPPWNKFRKFYYQPCRVCRGIGKPVHPERKMDTFTNPWDWEAGD